MRNKFFPAIFIIIYSSICLSSASATTCGHLRTYIANYSSLDWQYNQAESWYDGDAEHGGYTSESSDPNDYTYIFYGERDETNIEYHNSRKDHHLNVYTVYDSGSCTKKNENDSRLCDQFIPDGGRVQLWSYREKDTQSSNYTTIHTQAEGAVEDGKELSQFIHKHDGTCGNKSMGHGDKAAEAHFSLLDVPQQIVTATFQFSTAEQAAIAAQRAYANINTDSLIGLDQIYGAPITVDHTPGNSDATFTFRRACSKQSAEEFITECEAGGTDQTTCEKSSCYYQPAE